jgi:hypothetical protein
MLVGKMNDTLSSQDEGSNKMKVFLKPNGNSAGDAHIQL